MRQSFLLRSFRRLWALPLVPLWWAGTHLKNILYDLRLLRTRRLQWPVISVGSLSAGGAGKTPVVLMLARLLGEMGCEVDVLSRGYGRSSRLIEQVDPTGAWARFGDEPLQLARAGLKVFVGADRFAAGELAEKTAPSANNSLTPTRIHLLDDAFQHRRLVRDLDIVLLTAEDIREALLPADNLREGRRALGRADVVVLREEEAAELVEQVRRHSGAEVWLIRRELVLPPARPSRPMVFCGLARPEGLLTMLAAAGVETAASVFFADHHPYRHGDVERLLQAAKHADADGFLTTAKDAVKLSAAGRELLEQLGPVMVAELHVSLVPPATGEHVARKTLERVARRKPAREHSSSDVRSDTGIG